MANKVKNIRALSAETAREITQTPEKLDAVSGYCQSDL